MTDGKINELEDNLHSKKKDFGNISLRSELAQEFVSRKPGMMEKWAFSIFFFILLLLFIAGFFIKYPDIIEAKANLTAQNAPKEILAKQSGRLVKLFVKNNQQVNVNQTIAWIESTANHQEVLELSNKIDNCLLLLKKNDLAQMPNVLNKRYDDLGELQQSYQQFITAWQLFDDYMINGFFTAKKRSLEIDVDYLIKGRQAIQNQKILTEQDLKLSEESFHMQKKLSEERVISNEEFRSQTSKYVTKQMAMPQLQATLLANETQIRDKYKEIKQMNHDFAQQRVVFEQTLQSLKSEIDNWIKSYVLLSPINGRVYFIIPVQENQYFQGGKLLGYINPSDTHFYAETNLSQYNFGKIKTGLPVQLRFDAYPYEQTGFVAGKISYISSVPSDSGFLATIRLNKGLITNNNKIIPYKNGLKAKAIIITQDMRLIDRLYYNVIKSTSVGNHN